jgi:hypothetical protein
MTPELETLIEEHFPQYMSYLASITAARRLELEMMPYRPDILATLEWEITSKVTIHLAGGLCARCGGEASESHHQFYDRGRLCLDALEAVRHNCHQQLHGRRF